MARLRLVPWEPTWLVHTTLDIHAIYRRPRRDPDTWAIRRDADGFVEWDLTAGISVRQHHALLRKGFEYVTLATPDDVIQAADPSIQLRGAVPLGHPSRGIPDERPEVYLYQGAVRGPWDARAYLADLEDERQARRDRIEANIEQYGVDGAEAFERQTDPEFRMPARYRSPTPIAAPRKRGRPKGSKNQPKTMSVESTAEVPV